MASWIGGDIAGLQAMGTTMKSAPDEMNDVVHVLSSKVDQLANDANWKGNAADEFRKAWTQNSVQAGALATVVATVGSTLKDLGDKLHQIDADLYNTADEEGRKGAKIGPDGKPLTLVISGDANSPNAVAARQAQTEYTNFYNDAMTIAKGLRLQAAKSLSSAIGDVEPKDGEKPLTLDQKVTVADYLRGLYAAPNDRNAINKEKVPEKIEDAEKHLKDAREGMNKALDDFHAKGETLSLDNPAAQTHIAAVGDLKDLEKTLHEAEAGKGELPLSKVLNVKVADLGKLAPDLAKGLPSELKFLKEIPVVDVAASGLVAELQAEDDIDKGADPVTARSEDYGSAAIGLVAGAGTVAGIGAAAALGGVTAPVWGTALVAGGVVIGVGDLAYQGFHEHWSEDFTEHGGVFGGLKYGTANMFSNTGDTFVHLGTGVKDAVGGAVSSMWHSIF